VVEIAELLKVVNGTIVEDALVVLLEMIAPADDAAESVPSMITQLVRALKLPPSSSKSDVISAQLVST